MSEGLTVDAVVVLSVGTAGLSRFLCVCDHSHLRVVTCRLLS